MKLYPAKLCNLSIGIYFLFSFFRTIIGCFDRLPTIFNIATNVITVLLFGMVSLAAISIIRRVDLKISVFLSTVITLFIFNILIYNTIPTRLSEYMITFFITCIPLAILVHYVEHESFIKLMEKIGIIVGIICLVIIFLNFTGSIHLGVYNTSLGYSVLFPEICLINSLKGRKRIDMFWALVAVVSYLLAVLFFGSRGPIVSIVVFCIYNYLQKTKYDRKTIINIFTGIILSIIIALNFKYIMTWINSTISNIGINSRTLNLLANEFGHLSGRDNNYLVIIEEIMEHPFFIRGIASDTIITGGEYSHNIVLELLYEFGILIGGFLTIFVIYRVIIELFIHNYDEYKLSIMLMFSSITPLMFSSTIWMNCIFWMWIVAFKDKIVCDKTNDY